MRDEDDLATELVLHSLEQQKELYKALYDLLHALHPSSQRVAAQTAREVLAKYAPRYEKSDGRVG